MAGHSHSGSSSVPSLPPPCPKSPPEYPDLDGRRWEMAKVHVLEREIGFLEEELTTIQGLHPASRCCKEVAEFVVANTDPLIPLNRKNRRSRRFWKWLCETLSWIRCCCYSNCSIQLELPRCCGRSDCSLCNCHPCTCCSILKCWHCLCPRSCCSSSRDCCIFRFPSCPDCSCCQWKCPRLKGPKVRLCCSCKKNCFTCKPCSLLF